MNTLRIIAAIVLALHGLVHLMGTTSYLKLAQVQGLPYKTTVLGGRWNLGEVGIGVYGVLWAVAAVGFVVVAVAFLGDVAWWSSALIGVALFSLVLTSLDLSVAFAGVIVNAVILLALWIVPLVLPAPSRT
jgi:hypothetical protein